jgi:hypothetical protein
LQRSAKLHAAWLFAGERGHNHQDVIEHGAALSELETPSGRGIRIGGGERNQSCRRAGTSGPARPAPPRQAPGQRVNGRSRSVGDGPAAVLSPGLKWPTDGYTERGLLGRWGTEYMAYPTFETPR